MHKTGSRCRSGTGVGIEDQLAGAGQLLWRRRGDLRQRMLMGDEQPHFGLLRQPGEGDIRRITFLHFYHAQMRTAALQQIDNVAFLGDHPFQLNFRVALFEQLH